MSNDTKIEQGIRCPKETLDQNEKGTASAVPFINAIPFS
jgi:hypothetical protein